MSEQNVGEQSGNQSDNLSLSALIKRLNAEGRQALEIALGEALRLGHFWIGIEFLFMGLSKQKGSVFPVMLEKMGIHPGQFRGILRGMVDVNTREDWRKKDAANLGAEAFPQLQLADPDMLRKGFTLKAQMVPVMTPRVFRILQHAFKLSDNEQIGHKQLLWAAFRHRHTVAVQIFFTVTSKSGWTPERMLSLLAELGATPPENLLEEIPKSSEDVSNPLFSNSFSGQSAEDFQTIKGRSEASDGASKESADKASFPTMQPTQFPKQRLFRLENALKRSVLGQDKAITQIVQVLKNVNMRPDDTRKPLGVFLFVGPPGVGKTEVAQTLAEVLFGARNSLCQLNMAGFMEKQQVADLLGGGSGQLADHLHYHPSSVVLLDEMEKAHQDVHALLLTFFGTGRVTDPQGRLIDASKAVFIMTTNLGAEEALRVTENAENYKKTFKAAIDAHFSREFLHRIDRIVYFKPLDEETLAAIFDRAFALLQARLQTEKEVEIVISQDAKRQIIQHIAKQSRGAHPLRRLIEERIMASVSKKLSAGQYKPGTRITIA